MNVDVQVHIHGLGCEEAKELHHKLDQLLKGQRQIMSALDDANAALGQINDATNSIATVAQTISDEVNALIAAQAPGSTITPEFLQSLKDSASKAAALVPVLQGIASTGANNPVPVTPPTP